MQVSGFKADAPLQRGVLAASLAILIPCTIAVLLVSGCESNTRITTASPGSPSTPPSTPVTAVATFSVASITPAAGTTGVALSSNIQITFSGAANASTVNTTDITVTNPHAVAGTVTYNSTTNVATFTPSAALAANSTYTVTVRGVTSSSGTAMSAPFTSNFATVAATGGGGGTGGSGSGAPTMQYEASLFQDNSVLGQVSVDTTGTVTVQFSGATASGTYTVEFCPSWYNEGSSNPPPCFTVGTVSADSSGNANTTMKFPKTGGWAGDFEVNLNGGTPQQGYSTGLFSTSLPGAGSEVYMAALEPITTVNAGTVSSGPQDSLTSGTITFSQNLLTFTLTGAPADTTVNATENAVGLGGSDSYLLETSQNQSMFTTNSSGSLTFTVEQDGVFGDLFLITPQGGDAAGYLSGFTVPKS